MLNTRYSIFVVYFCLDFSTREKKHHKSQIWKIKGHPRNVPVQVKLKGKAQVAQKIRYELNFHTYNSHSKSQLESHLFIKYHIKMVFNHVKRK